MPGVGIIDHIFVIGTRDEGTNVYTKYSCFWHVYAAIYDILKCPVLVMWSWTRDHATVVSDATTERQVVHVSYTRMHQAEHSIQLGQKKKKVKISCKNCCVYEYDVIIIRVHIVLGRFPLPPTFASFGGVCRRRTSWELISLRAWWKWPVSAILERLLCR